MRKITILGTGAYGIALALMFHENPVQITMWTKFKEEADMLLAERCHEKVLPNVMIPNDIVIETDLKKAVLDTSLIVVATPAQFVEDVMKEVKLYLKGDECFLVASKGIERKNNLFVHEIVLKMIDTEKIGAISGPTFAIDLASRAPSSLTLATQNEEVQKLVLEVLPNSYLKVHPIKDIIGTEICGSVKNIMAIASGMIAGMGLPISTQAMFITDALTEIKTIISSLGGDPTTILSYAGIGDLLLTCMSDKSRNFQLGKLYGEGRTQEEIEQYSRNTTVEGLYTLDSITSLFKKNKTHCPMITLIYDIIQYRESSQALLSFLIQNNASNK